MINVPFTAGWEPLDLSWTATCGRNGYGLLLYDVMVIPDGFHRHAFFVVMISRIVGRQGDIDAFFARHTVLEHQPLVLTTYGCGRCVVENFVLNSVSSSIKNWDVVTCENLHGMGTTANWYNNPNHDQYQIRNKVAHYGNSKNW
jgi:hypothetical protein